jgi:hypothetical protein
MDNLWVATPYHAESANHEVSQGDIAPPKSAPEIERNELLSSVDNSCLDAVKLRTEEL